MNLKRLLAGTAAAALLAVTASCGSNSTSKTSYRLDETSKASDSVPAGTGYDSKVVASNSEDTYEYNIRLYDNGSASININCRNREAITFLGQLETNQSAK
jgi:hypothetical protein